MIIGRKYYIDTISQPMTKVRNIMSYYLFGAIISFFINGFKIEMGIQLAVSFLAFFLYRTSFNKANYDRETNPKQLVKKTDLATIMFCVFIIGYYVIYYTFKISNNQLEYYYLILTVLALVATYKVYFNGLATNTLLNNLPQFAESDSIEIPDENWIDIVRKWKINDTKADALYELKKIRKRKEE